MSSIMMRHVFERLMQENIDWLKEQPRPHLPHPGGKEDPQPGPSPADGGFLSVPCPEFYERPICIRIKDRSLEYAYGSEGYQMPRTATIEEEALYQAVKDSLTVESPQGAPSPAPAGDHRMDYPIYKLRELEREAKEKFAQSDAIGTARVAVEAGMIADMLEKIKTTPASPGTVHAPAAGPLVEAGAMGKVQLALLYIARGNCSPDGNLNSMAKLSRADMQAVAADALEVLAGAPSAGPQSDEQWMFAWKADGQTPWLVQCGTRAEMMTLYSRRVGSWTYSYLCKVESGPALDGKPNRPALLSEAQNWIAPGAPAAGPLDAKERCICLGCGDLDARCVSIPNAPGTGDADEGCAKCGGSDFADSMGEAITRLVTSSNAAHKAYFESEGKRLDMEINSRAGAPSAGRPMTWTREKPTKPGWYWRQTLTSEDHIHIVERGGELFFSEPGESDVDLEHSIDAADRLWSWAGPIPEPVDERSESGERSEPAPTSSPTPASGAKET